MGDSVGSSSITITTHDDLSVLYRILRFAIRPFRPRLASPGKPLPAGSPQLSIPNTKCTIREEKLEEVYQYRFQLESGAKQAAGHDIYYFAGGGFQSPPTKDHWKMCAELCIRLERSYNVFVVSYPLAPKSPASESLPILQTWLRTTMTQAMQENRNVTLMGDSAGGNIALSLAFWWAVQPEAQDKMSPLKNVFAISPAVDLRNENPDIYKTDKNEPILSVTLTGDVAKAWAGSLSRADPKVSPLLADFELLKSSNVQVHGVVGSHDILAPDAVLFRDRCADYEIRGEWLQWEGQMHCFPLAFAYGLSESKRAVEWMVDVLRRNA